MVRRLKPSCLVSFGNTTPVVNYGFTNYMDYQSGDCFSPSNHRYVQSLAMRRYTTLGIPYEVMTCDTAYLINVNIRSLPKTLDRMLQEGAGAHQRRQVDLLDLSHAQRGADSFADAVGPSLPRLGGRARRYDRLQKIHTNATRPVGARLLHPTETARIDQSDRPTGLAGVCILEGRARRFS